MWSMKSKPTPISNLDSRPRRSMVVSSKFKLNLQLSLNFQRLVASKRGPPLVLWEPSPRFKQDPKQPL